MSALYLYPTHSHSYQDFGGDSWGSFASGFGQTAQYTDPFDHVIRLAHEESRARQRQEQEVLAANLRRRRLQQAREYQIYRQRVEEQRVERQRQQQRRQLMAALEAEAQRQYEHQQQERRRQIAFQQQRRQEIELRRALDAHAARAQYEQELKYQRALEHQQRQAHAEPADIDDVFQTLQQAMQHIAGPFFNAYLQDDETFEHHPQQQQAAGPSTASKDEEDPEDVDISSSTPVDATVTAAIQPEATASTASAPQKQPAATSIPVTNAPVASQEEIKSDTESTRGRSRSPRRARVSDVDEDGNELVRPDDADDDLHSVSSSHSLRS